MQQSFSETPVDAPTDHASAAPVTDALVGYYADHFVLPLPPGHRFPMGKYRLLRDHLASQPGVQLHEAPAATPGELALAHSPHYIDAVLDGTLAPALVREIGFPWSPAMAERARRSVGATLAAARRALGLHGAAAEGVSGNLAGGTHHASADRGGGFCVFNDMAVAARLMQAEHSRAYGVGHLLQVAVIDLDVHQGNGTAAIFANDPSVFTLSMHGERNFPARKVPVPPAPIWTHLTAPCTNLTCAFSPAWCCMWRALIRTRATAWGGSRSAPTA
jgi:acetoin utilization deacetylase AcuC-like enzyme